MPMHPLTTAAAGDVRPAPSGLGVSAPGPRTAAVVVGASAVLVSVLAWWTHDHVPALDAVVSRFFDRHRTPDLHRVAGYASRLGSMEVVIPSALVAGALLAIVRRSARPFAVVAATYLCAAAPAAFLKKSLQRPEPFDTADAIGRSFPSGHATQAAAVCGVIAVLVVATVRWVIIHRAVIAAAAIVPLLVGLAMLVRGAHWLTDVIGGYAIAASAVVAVLAFDTLIGERRWWRPRRSDPRRTAPGRAGEAGRS